MFSKPAHVITQRANPQYKLSLADRGKQYLVGFYEKKLADRVSTLLPPKPSLYILRNSPESIKDAVNNGLRNFGVEEIQTDLVIDVDATLSLLKPKYKIPDDLYHIEEMTMSDFMMIPFNYNLGVTIAKDIFKETEHQLILACDVIDPTLDISSFRNNIRLS
jgi:hypothetical protein